MPIIALFGSTGQIGSAILSALLDARFDVLQLLSPGSESRARPEGGNLTSKTVDLATVSRSELASVLAGIHAVVSALNGKALEAQGLIQDAAWDAGVQRFYPSEFGMHHIYRPPGDLYGYVHPVWNIKSQHNEKCTMHPSILSGQMTYTIIGCGDFYNQPREKTWCPWAQTQPGTADDRYRIPVLGNANALVDFTHTDDMAAFLVQTLVHPDAAQNKTLKFVSDCLSFSAIAGLLQKYSQREVDLHIMPLEAVYRAIRDPANVPRELGYAPEESKSAMPVDFWFLVRAVQGEGRFRYAPGDVSNGLFPGVKVTTVEEYLSGLFGS